MRYSGRYAILTAFLAGALILKFNNIDQAYEEVEPFRGASIQTEIWNPLIADSVNQKEISLLVDAKSYTSRDMNVFMDDNLNLMIPVKALRDSFDCSAHIYHGTELLVEKYANEVTFPLNKDEVTVNSEKEEVSSGMRQIDGEYYVPLETLSDSLGYTYSWNMEENSAVTASGKSSDVTIVPASYDLRDKLRAPGVKDQGNHGTCWAFASLTALESSLLPEESYDFSPDHMSIQNSFALNQDYGGDYTMSLAYLLAWQGPVLEEDDPYGDDKSDDSLMPVKHVQEVQIIGSKDFQKIKEAVFKYGGVQTSIYSALKSSQSHSEFYNSKTKAYCYMGQEKPNHDVVIIGWDDNYSRIISRWIWKVTAHLSARTAGEMISGITGSFMFPIMILISAFIMWCIPGLRMLIITMIFTSQTSADGSDSLGLTPVIFSGQMYFRHKRQRISARQVFTRLVRTRNIVFIWCLILQIPRRWQKGRGSRLRKENSEAPVITR